MRVSQTHNAGMLYKTVQTKATTAWRRVEPNMYRSGFSLSIRSGVKDKAHHDETTGTQSPRNQRQHSDSKSNQQGSKMVVTDRPAIDSKGFAKLMRSAPGVLSKHLTAADCDLIFVKCKVSWCTYVRNMFTIMSSSYLYEHVTAADCDLISLKCKVSRCISALATSVHIYEHCIHIEACNCCWLWSHLCQMQDALVLMRVVGVKCAILTLSWCALLDDGSCRSIKNVVRTAKYRLSKAWMLLLWHLAAC